MAQTCDACGKPATRSRYWADGPLVGRTLCWECTRDHTRWTRLSLFVTFQIRIARALPPGDPITVPALRLFMAADDLRRARIQLIDAHERLGGPPTPEKSRATGDFLYNLRLLFSHLYEAGNAMRSLDAKNAARVNGTMSGNVEALEALQAVRTEVNDREYKKTLIGRLRNGIGFHYRDDVIGRLAAHFDDDTRLHRTIRAKAKEPHIGVCLWVRSREPAGSPSQWTFVGRGPSDLPELGRLVLGCAHNAPKMVNRDEFG